MPECKKCGAKVKEDMSFCPNCGASLREVVAVAPKPSAPAQAPAPPPATHVRYEKEEKREKGEKREKHEKGEYGWIGPFIGGVILIIIGLVSYFEVTGILNQATRQILWAFFIIIVGILLIFGAVYAMTTARRRYPRT
jgi:uncharacterized Zn finger protein (UPF0148 family)